MLVSNWEVSKRGTPPLASGESAVRMPRAANLCAGLLLPDRKAPVCLGAYSLGLWVWKWILYLRGACRKPPLFSETPSVCEYGLVNLAVINVPMWCLWNRLQNVLGDCSSSTLHCQLQKHQGSWKTEMTKNCSIQIKKRYFLLWAKRGLLLHCVSLIGRWSFFIYFYTAWTIRKLYKKVLLLDTDLCLHFHTQMTFLCLSSFLFFCSFLAQLQVLQKETHPKRPSQQCRSSGCPSHSFSLSAALTNAVSKDSSWGSWGCKVKPWGKRAPASISDVNLICHF